MPFNIPTGGFGGGAELGSIYAKVGADLSDFDRGMAEAAMTMRATASEMRSSGNSIGSDAEKTGRRVRAGMKDGERALSDFDKTANYLSRTLNGGPFGLVGAMGSVSGGAFKLGGFVDKTTSGFLSWATDAEQAGGELGTLGQGVASLIPLVGAITGGTALFGEALLIIPALAGAAAFALTFLLDSVTTLAAVVAGFVAPLSLFAGLVGLLGGGFYLAGQRALQGGGQFSAFATKVEHLQGQFASLVRTLAGDFEPVFWRIANVAQVALNYFDKLAHMDNLRQAFRSLSTEGVGLLNKLVYGIGNTLASPFKLAVKFAFDSNGMGGAMSSWWTSFTNYLFGYTKTKTIHIGAQIVLDKQHVNGALNPISEWFGKQDFTKTAITWSNEIINGVIHGMAAKNLEAWAGTVGAHAGNNAGKAFKAMLEKELTGWFKSYFEQNWQSMINPIPTIAAHAASLIKSHIGGVWDAIKTKATGIWDSIVGYVGSHVPHPHLDWGNVVSTAEGIWDSIVSYIESHIPHPSIHLSIPTPSFPSLPSWLHPHTGGIVSGRGGGGLVTAATGGMFTGGISGRDSIPALVTPGEIILNAGQQRNVAGRLVAAQREERSDAGSWRPSNSRPGRGFTLTIPDHEMRRLFQAYAANLGRQG